jgi:hypothetical protein
MIVTRVKVLPGPTYTKEELFKKRKVVDKNLGRIKLKLLFPHCTKIIK